MRSFVLCAVLGSTACGAAGAAQAPAAPAVAPATAALETPVCWRSFEDFNDPVCPVQGSLSEEERAALMGPAGDVAVGAETTAVAVDAL
jgi:hypothetical protein